jgi:hypothetical protein
MHMTTTQIVTMPMDLLVENMKARLQQPGVAVTIPDYGISEDRKSLWFKCQMTVTGPLPEPKKKGLVIEK